MSDQPSIVIDSGSYMIKAGMAGWDDEPSVVFPTIVGRYNHNVDLEEPQQKSE